MYSTNEQEKIAKLEQKIEELSKENEGLKIQDQKSGIYAKFLGGASRCVFAAKNYS